MELTFIGGQNIYLTGNPQISFFKAVYKTHTNFSMESKRLEFNKTTLSYSNSENNKYICNIIRHADLVSQMYFCFILPDIYKPKNNKDNYYFRWVKNIGEVIIENCEIYIGGALIDKQYGEWIHIWNELTIPFNQKELYNKMIGNITEMYNPAKDDKYPGHSIDKSNLTNYISYPGEQYNSDDSIPSIRSRQIIVPLNFWFNTNIGLALPLISMQYQDIKIKLELKTIQDLYQIYDSIEDKYIKPNNNNPDHRITNFVNNVKYNLDININNIENKIDIDPYIEANYIFLDNIERETFSKRSLDFLIEQTIKKDFLEIKNPSDILNLELNNPVKELIWVFKPNYNKKYNDWFNFIDNSINKDILITARLILNGLDRTEDKKATFYNMIQPYQHHQQTKDGIYLYSFSLKPNIFQPSGSCNMSKVNKIQLFINTNTPNTVGTDTDYKYDLTLYSISYNFLRIISGSGNIAFHL